MNKGIKRVFVACVATLISVASLAGALLVNSCAHPNNETENEQFEPLLIQAAEYTSGMDLFISGTDRYNTYKSDIAVGKIYAMYGANWTVVKIEGDVATFLSEDLENACFDDILSGATSASNITPSKGMRNGYNRTEISYNGSSSYGPASIASRVNSRAAVYNSYPSYTRILSSTSTEGNTLQNITGKVYFKVVDSLVETPSGSTATAKVKYNVTGETFWIPSEAEFKTWNVNITEKTWTRTPVLTDNKTVRTVIGQTSQDASYSNSTVTDIAKLRLAVHFDISTAKSYQQLYIRTSDKSSSSNRNNANR